jgi:hypothetical protein
MTTTSQPMIRQVRALLLMGAVGVALALCALARGQGCNDVPPSPPACTPIMIRASISGYANANGPNPQFDGFFDIDPSRPWNGTYGPWGVGLGMSPWYASSSNGSVAGTMSATPCSQQTSACWRMDEQSLSFLISATTPTWGNTRGFPLNLDVYNLPATTNYPPLSQNAMASTAPFVSIPGDQTYRPIFLTDRKVVAGVVDPMTGQPLIREEDLDLPVGRATFRLIRTYGGNADGSAGPIGKTYDGQGDRLAIGKLWDWAGTGWMISENPILLFDAQYIQHEPSLPRRCFLILDAHHSIPFTQDVETGNYIAPAWFDAIMTWREPENGDPIPCGHYTAATTDTPATWTWHPNQSPKTIKVRLYGESVTYTFKINYEDMAPLPVTATHGLDAHASPLVKREGGLSVETPGAGGGGLGTPYTAFLQKIEDRFGNRAEFDHCAHRAYSVNPGENCESCVHTCAEKGQIKTVKLFHAGNTTTPDWTLLYVHRSFRTWAPDLSQVPCAAEQLNGAVPVSSAPLLVSAKDKESKWFLQNAVHAVFVYKGDDNVQMPTIGDDEWTLPAEAFVGVADGSAPNGFSSTYSSLDAQDDLLWTENKISTHLHWTVPDHWRYRLRYTYDETIKPLEGCNQPDVYRTSAGASIPDPSDPSKCLAPPMVTANRVTQFGGLSDVPRIFHWGTPLQTKFSGEEGNGPEVIDRPRITPCLLRVEKTERPKGQPGSDNTTYTGYLYATHLDDPTSLLDPLAPADANGPTAAALDRVNCLNAVEDHLYERIVPKLKNILRDDRLRAAMKKNGSSSINSARRSTSRASQPKVLRQSGKSDSGLASARRVDAKFGWQLCAHRFRGRRAVGYRRTHWTMCLKPSRAGTTLCADGFGRGAGKSRSCAEWRKRRRHL